MNGKIWVESEMGRGSAFHFTNAWVLDERAESRSAPLSTQLNGLSVLLVDDNATNLRVLEGMLGRWGMRTTSVNGGHATLRAIRESQRTGVSFGLILLDGQMPEIDGFTLAQQIREDLTLAGVTIMMLTSAGHMQETARCRELGIAAYLVKPIRQAELLDSIRRVLNNSPKRAARASSAFHSPASSKGRKILVAEDNPVNQMFAQRILEKKGFEVKLASDGRGAVAAVANETFDLVLMDVQMPYLDGLQATISIRQMEKGTGLRLPIIALTAHAMAEDHARCLAAGMDAYLSKPIRTKELFAAIEEIIGRGGDDRACATSESQFELELNTARR